MALKNIASIGEKTKGHPPKGIEGHTMSTQNGQELCLHATRYEIVVALIAAGLL